MNQRAKVSKAKNSIPSDMKSKLAWTFGILCIYFALLHIGLVGIPRNIYYTDPQDPLSLFRVITASQRGSLAEFGILPIVLSIVIFQILIGSKLIKVDFTKK